MSNKAPKSRRKPQKAKKKTKRISLLGVVLGTATLAGGIAAYLSFLPRLTVEISDPSESNAPFSSSVTVRNSGFIPLNDVTTGVAIKDIQPITGVEMVGGPNDYGSVVVEGSSRRTLGLDQALTFSLSDYAHTFHLRGDQAASAQIGIVVYYSLPLIRIRRQKVFPFYLQRQDNGTLIWYHDAMKAN